MAWARIDDSFHDHPKSIGLPLEAVGLWTLCLTWAHRHQGASYGVFGHIPEHLPVQFGGSKGPKLAALLAQRGLWDNEPNIGGWVIHDYVDYLPKAERPQTSDEVKKARSEAGKRGAVARWEKAKAQQADDKLLDQSHDDDMPPSRPVPDPNPSVEASESGHRPVTLLPDPTRCSLHQGDLKPPPCRGCQQARESYEKRTKLALVDARLHCPDCHGEGWLTDDEGNLTRKCDHHNRRQA